uniref:Putative active regulator of sirt1-like copidosoma floridanum n=1 Tax=Xenopsylla cheopis TaxID=163159 RepID=A0A6M2DIU7_XENCH
MSASLVHKSLQILKSDTVLSQDKKSNEVKKRKKNNKKAGNSTKKITLKQLQQTVEDEKHKLEANLHKLQLLSSRKLDSETAEKVFKRTVKNSKPKEEEIVDTEGTAFTEEDFFKFEQEYFCA